MSQKHSCFTFWNQKHARNVFCLLSLGGFNSLNGKAFEINFIWLLAHICYRLIQEQVILVGQDVKNHIFIIVL